MSILKCLQLLLNYSFVPTYFIYFMFTGSWVSVQMQRQINCDFRTTQACLDVDISLHRCSRETRTLYSLKQLLSLLHILMYCWKVTLTQPCISARKNPENEKDVYICSSVRPPSRSHLSPHYLCFFFVASLFHSYEKKTNPVYFVFIYHILPLMWRVSISTFLALLIITLHKINVCLRVCLDFNVRFACILNKGETW